MRINEKKTTVAGQTFSVWHDYFMRGTFAESANGEEKRIAYGSYLMNDLTIRKAIAAAYKLPTFRK